MIKEIQANEASGNTPEASHFQWKWLDLLLVTAGAGLLLIGGSLLIRWGSDQLAGFGITFEKTTFGLVSASLEILSLMASLYFLGIVRNKTSWSALGFVLPSPQWTAVGVLLGFFAIPLAAAVTLLMQTTLNLPAENPQLEYLLPAEFSWGGLLAGVLLVGVLVPIAEEAYFRGLVYQVMRGSWRMSASLVISSAYFGIMHGNILVGGMAFVLGLILGWIFERSRSLWPGIIVHMINNGIKIFLIYLMVLFGFLPT